MSDHASEAVVHVLQAGIDRQNELLARIADALDAQRPVEFTAELIGEPVGAVIGYRVMGVPPLDLGRFFARREDADRAAGINSRVVEVREVSR